MTTYINLGYLFILIFYYIWDVVLQNVEYSTAECDEGGLRCEGVAGLQSVEATPVSLWSAK